MLLAMSQCIHSLGLWEVGASKKNLLQIESRLDVLIQHESSWFLRFLSSTDVLSAGIEIENLSVEAQAATGLAFNWENGIGETIYCIQTWSGFEQTHLCSDYKHQNQWHNRFHCFQLTHHQPHAFANRTSVNRSKRECSCSLWTTQPHKPAFNNWRTVLITGLLYGSLRRFPETFHRMHWNMINLCEQFFRL